MSSPFTPEKFSHEDEEKEELEYQQVFRLEHDTRPLKEQIEDADNQIDEKKKALEKARNDFNSIQLEYQNCKSEFERKTPDILAKYMDYEKNPSSYKDTEVKPLAELRINYFRAEAELSTKIKELEEAEQHRKDLDATNIDAYELLNLVKNQQAQTQDEFDELNKKATTLEEEMKSISGDLDLHRKEAEDLLQQYDELLRQEREAFKILIPITEDLKAKLEICFSGSAERL